MNATSKRSSSKEDRRSKAPPPTDETSEASSIRVWDRPTRVFHWLLALLFVVCYISGNQGYFEIHLIAGQTLAVLVLTRILWGFFGSDSALFRNFLRPPREVIAYLSKSFLRSQPDGAIGHNPLGGLAVAVMLAAFIVHCALGIFAENVDGYASGPLSFLVDYEMAREAADWHHESAHALLVLIGLHLAAILFHLFYKRENLIVPMLTGRADIKRSAAVGEGEKIDGPPPPSPRLRFASDLRALLLLALVAGAFFGGLALAQRFL